jgi:hypothetical protein
MDSNLEQSINHVSQTFCEYFGYNDCKEVGKKMNSIIYKATSKNTGKEVCFKTIPELEFNKNKEEWNIIKLLKKF